MVEVEVRQRLAMMTGVRKRRVTITDIARHLGLSQPTVSTVLLGAKGNTRVSDEVRQRVMRAAQQFGYRPNAGARAMKMGRFNAVGVCATNRDGHSNLPDPLLQAIHDALALRNTHMIYTRLPDEKLTSDGFVPKILKEYMIDGVIVSYTHEIPQPMLDLIHKHSVPAVWINANLPHNCVVPDDRMAARQATELLLQAGHQRIAYTFFNMDENTLLGKKGHHSVASRFAGYSDAMRAAGLQPRYLCSPAATQQGSHPRIDTAWLDRSDAPTALVMYSNYGAASVAAALRERGKSVPADCSLVTFDTMPTWIDDLAVHTWLIPHGEIGRTSVEMLMQIVSAGDGRMVESATVAFRHHPGASMMPPRAG